MTIEEAAEAESIVMSAALERAAYIEAHDEGAYPGAAREESAVIRSAVETLARHFTGVLPLNDVAETSLPWEYEDTVPLAKDHPDMIAWEAYKATPGYANTLRWATEAQHTEGSLWAAFIAGRESTVPDIREPDGYRDGDLLAVLIEAHGALVHGGLNRLQHIEALVSATIRHMRAAGVTPIGSYGFGTPLQGEQEKP